MVLNSSRHGRATEPPVDRIKYACSLTHFPWLLDRRRARHFSVSSARCVGHPHRSTAPNILDKGRSIFAWLPTPSSFHLSCPPSSIPKLSESLSRLPSPESLLFLNGKALSHFRTLLVPRPSQSLGMRGTWLLTSLNVSLRLGARNTVRFISDASSWPFSTCFLNFICTR